MWIGVRHAPLMTVSSVYEVHTPLLSLLLLFLFTICSHKPWTGEWHHKSWSRTVSCKDTAKHCSHRHIQVLGQCQSNTLFVWATYVRCCGISVKGLIQKHSVYPCLVNICWSTHLWQQAWDPFHCYALLLKLSWTEHAYLKFHHTHSEANMIEFCCKLFRSRPCDSLVHNACAACDSLKLILCSPISE